MARLSRAEIFDPAEIVAVHTMARTNRRCFLMGDDQFTGKNASTSFPRRRESSGLRVMTGFPPARE